MTTASAASLLSRTPSKTSPLNLMQEAYRDDPWALLVGCIMFNVVHGKKARPILEDFLVRWSTPSALWLHNNDSADTLVSEMAILMKPLGFQNRRADRIWKMTFDYLVLDPGNNRNVDIQDLHGIGKYAADSFNIFCRGYLVLDVQDKELRNYVRWALSPEARDERDRAGGILQTHPRPPTKEG